MLFTTIKVCRFQFFFQNGILDDIAIYDMKICYLVDHFCRHATFLRNAGTKQQHDRLIQCPHQSSPCLSYVEQQQKQNIPADTLFENNMI